MSRNKKSDHEEHEGGHERWLVSYADFITLLFAFFVILYATSNKDLEKAQEFQDSVKRYLIKGGGTFGGSTSPKIEQEEINRSVIETPLPTYRSNKKEDLEILEAAEAQIEQKLSVEDRRKYIIDLSGEDIGVRLVIANKDIFAPGTAKFQADSMDFINRLGEILKTSGRKIMVEGHVGSQQKGQFNSSWELASSRAILLVRYLQQKFEMAPSQLIAVSAGDSRPLAQSSATNDRLEVVILYDDNLF